MRKKYYGPKLGRRPFTDTSSNTVTRGCYKFGIWAQRWVSTHPPATSTLWTWHPWGKKPTTGVVGRLPNYALPHLHWDNPNPSIGAFFSRADFILSEDRWYRSYFVALMEVLTFTFGRNDYMMNSQ